MIARAAALQHPFLHPPSTIRPIHAWLLRHVYQDAMRAGVSRRAALVATFATSIVLHEAILWGAFRRPVFPYLALLSLAQLPLADLMRSPALKRRVIGNFFVWSGLIGGVALVTTLYAKELRGGGKF